LKRTFVSNLILILTVNLLVKPFYILGIEAEVQNRVGAEVYGSYFALISFSFLLNILLDMGITSFNTRNIAQNNQLLQKHFSGIVMLRFVLFVVYSVILLTVGLCLGYSQSQMGILAILALNQGFAAFILYLRSNLTALHKFKADSLLSVLDRLFLIMLMAVLLWGNVMDQPFQIEWFVYGQGISYAVGAIVGFGLVLYHSGKIKFKFDRVFMTAILKQSMPYALLVFLMAVYFRTDSVMLERMHPNGAFEAGIYAMGFRFFEAGNMVAFLFGILLLPIFSKMIKKGENVQPIASLSFKLLFSGALILALVCVSLSKTVLDIRYVSHTVVAAPVFALLMVGFVFVCCTYIFGTLLTANGSLKRLNQFAVAGVVINIILNVILIPDYGAYGCALASVVTLGLVAISQMIETQRVFKFRITKGFRQSLLIFLAGVITLFLLVATLSIGWQVKMLILIVGGLGFAVSTGMLHMGRFLTLILNREAKSEETTAE
jgi:O-antigen/teichoic acid export membrane protein